MSEALDLIDHWSGAGDGRITTMLGPHAPYTCPPQPLAEVIALAKSRRIPLHIHLAETVEEVEKIGARYSQTPTEYLHELGLFADSHVRPNRCCGWRRSRARSCSASLTR